MATVQEVKVGAERAEETSQKGLFQLWPGVTSIHTKSGRKVKVLLVDMDSESVFIAEMCKWLPASDFEITK